MNAVDEDHLPGWPSPDGLIMHNADAVEREAEFLRLLREILAGSGRTAGKVAAYSGSVLPRSTAYRFVSPSNHRLPQYQDQVEAFLGGCGCHPATIDRMVEAWRRLGTIPPAELVENAGLGTYGSELEPRPTGALRKLPGFATRQDIPTLPDLAEQDGRVVVHGDVNISVNGLGNGPGDVTTESRPGILHTESGADPTELSVSVFRLLEIRLKSGGADHDLVRRVLLCFLILMAVFTVVSGGLLATAIIMIR